MANIYEALVSKAGKQVTLTLGAAEGEGARDVVVVPIADEAELYYYDWVEGNIKKVSDATDGKVGYLHVPDMQTVGLDEFAKHFYPQVRKKALIIDVRGNGGGNVSPMLIERLTRQTDMITIARNSIPETSPPAMIYGPKIVPDERVLGLGRRPVPVPLPGSTTSASWSANGAGAAWSASAARCRSWTAAR